MKKQDFSKSELIRSATLCLRSVKINYFHTKVCRLGFEVESVDKKIAELKEKGVTIQGGPFSPNPHIKFFYVMDPNGLKIQFLENM